MKTSTTKHHTVSAPMDLVHRAVANAVRYCYGIQIREEVRIARWQRPGSRGSLEYIDYAVPLFELAKKVNSRPFDVANRIAERLSNNRHLTKVEAVGGYVNIQISNNTLSDMTVRMKATLSKSSHVLAPRTFLLVGHEQASTKASHKALTYIYESTELFAKRRPTKVTLLINDLDGNDLSPKDLRLDSLEADIVLASSISKQVSDFIDRIYVKYGENKGIIMDSKTKAAYFTLNDESVPLRDINGRVTFSALTLYSIYLLKNDTRQIKTSIVVLAPQKHHPLINVCFNFLSFVGKRKNLVCFDPNISSADIRESEGFVNSVSNLLQLIEELLPEVRLQLDHSGNKRKNALAVLDFQYDLERFLSNDNYPAVFDLLNQTTANVTSLSR